MNTWDWGSGEKKSVIESMSICNKVFVDCRLSRHEIGMCTLKGAVIHSHTFGTRSFN